MFSALLVLKVSWVPPVKSMPLLSPLMPRLMTAATTMTAETENQILRRETKLTRSQRVPEPTEPSTRGLAMNLKRPSSPSMARVATTAVKIDVTTPISSISAKPFTDEVAVA